MCWNTRWNTRGLLLVAPLMAWASPSLAGSNDCPALSDADNSRLVIYVARKYQIPDSVKIGIKDSFMISDKCYRKVVFAGPGPLGEVSLALYLSPDLRFLSPDLFDSSIDPDREREENARRAMGELTEGEFASSGSATAPVTVVVFSDFQCPFCKQAAEILREESLIRNGVDVRLVFRHMPLPMHPWAQQAAQAAACAQFQSGTAFWAFHDALFRDQPQITQQNISARISGIGAGIPGIDQTKFKECMDRQMSLGVVLRDKDLAQHSGATGTPTVFVNGSMIPGMGGAAEFHKLLESAIHKQRAPVAMR